MPFGQLLWPLLPRDSWNLGPSSSRKGVEGKQWVAVRGARSRWLLGLTSLIEPAQAGEQDDDKQEEEPSQYQAPQQQVTLFL